jgi:hypothetical protein
MYSSPALGVMAVDAMVAWPIKPHILSLSTFGPCTTSTAVSGWQAAWSIAIEQIRITMVKGVMTISL